MTHTPTAAQLADMALDMGISDMTVRPFTDDQLSRFYDRAGGDYETAIVYGLRALLGLAHKYAVYTVGADSLNKQKIFDNLKDLIEVWEKAAGLEGGTLRSGTISTGIDMPDFTSFDEFYSNPLLWSGL